MKTITMYFISFFIFAAALELTGNSINQRSIDANDELKQEYKHYLELRKLTKDI
jgi:hypothetical protein